MTNVRALCEQCHAERVQWRSEGDKSEEDKKSPGCAGLFRSWFAGDAEAWGCVSELFGPLLTSWVFSWLAQPGSQRLLTAEDVPEIVHDVHERLEEYVRRYPDKAAQLVEGEDISKVLGFVKTTTKRRVLEICRRRGRHPEEPLLLGDEPEQEGGGVAEPVVPSFADSVIDRIVIEEAMRRCLGTEAEKVIAFEILLCRVRSREVLKLYPHLFADIDSVYETTHQVRECLRQTLNEQNAED